MPSSFKLQLPRRSAAVSLPGEDNVLKIESAASAGNWPGLGGVGYGNNGHQAADDSMARGMVYFPQLDTAREITSFTRTEILRKVRYLYANVGFPRRVVNGVARMVVGTGLMPRPKTRARDWNKLAHSRMEAVYGSAFTYDLAGKFNGYRAQLARLKCAYKDGDIGSVFTRDPDTGRAITAAFEGHQIGSGRLQQGEEKTVLDGVRINPARHNRPEGYRLLTGNDDSTTEVPAHSFCLLANLERLGQLRGLSILAHAVPHLIDRSEIKSYFKGSIKNSARVGYYIGASKDTVPTTNPKPGGSAGNRQVITMSTGDKVALERVYSGHGGEVQRLNPGEDLKMLLDERPHPNTLGFLDELIRDISLGVDLHPEVLWNIVKLGGANVRYVMQDAQSFVETQQQILVDTMLGPEYIWFLSDEIASGRLPACPDPEWWNHEWITPARWTVDYGRDGKLNLEQLKSGALTFRRFFGWQGLGLDELDEWLDEVQHVRDGARVRFLDENGKPDPKMEQFILQALYQRVGLASSLDTTAADLAALDAPVPADPSAP